MSWDLYFSDPILLPNSGLKLTTLRDASAYIAKLPKADHDAKEWQTAMLCLIEAADNGGSAEFARTGMLQALNCHIERAIDPSRRTIIGDAKSWRATDDGSGFSSARHGRRPC